MSWSQYHLDYQKQSEGKILQKAFIKKQELDMIFSRVELQTNSDKLKIAVLGCGDVRLIRHHREIFHDLFNKEIDLVTMDVTTEHLVGEAGVKKHDCILPLPGGPFDLIYGHVLLKFIETDKQYNVLINAYQALKSGGVAVQVIDREEIGGGDKQFETGYWPVPLDKWREKLAQEKIMTELIELEYGVGLVFKKKLINNN